MSTCGSMSLCDCLTSSCATVKSVTANTIMDLFLSTGSFCSGFNINRRGGRLHVCNCVRACVRARVRVRVCVCVCVLGGGIIRLHFTLPGNPSTKKAKPILQPADWSLAGTFPCISRLVTGLQLRL